ncbi:MAG: 2-C-methyl-D-erythritol 2,4-cyclodiphosphate synthase [Planctomycetota bacterium]|nr:2-C-methyl-D-erythritol 2,4-cyclodiphosphate synthase [Planctomycetota bacterium]
MSDQILKVPDLPAIRVGHGYDIHRLRESGKLVLAGVNVADDLSPIAHSDGDVVLHALVDALLGAIGGGDIGEMFPNNDPRWKGAASSIFVEAALHEAKKRGFAVVNVDVTIMAERPRLKPHKSAMVEALLRLVGGAVNVKAGTNEGCDAVGRGEAIAAHVVVLLAGTHLT